MFRTKGIAGFVVFLLGCAILLVALGYVLGNERGRADNERRIDELTESVSNLRGMVEGMSVSPTIVPQSAPRPAPRLVQVAYRPSSHEAQVRYHLTRWANKYGVRDRAWLVAKGMYIARRESHYNPKARNGRHLGVFQMQPGWGSAAQRTDISWSCRRYVKAYVEGGRANLRKHWTTY